MLGCPPVQCQAIREPIEHSAKLTGVPIKSAGKSAHRVTLVRRRPQGGAGGQLAAGGKPRRQGRRRRARSRAQAPAGGAPLQALSSEPWDPHTCAPDYGLGVPGTGQGLRVRCGSSSVRELCMLRARLVLREVLYSDGEGAGSVEGSPSFPGQIWSCGRRRRNPGPKP